MTDVPQPLAPGSPLTLGPEFEGAPINAEDDEDLEYPVVAKNTGTGILAPAPTPPFTLANDFYFHTGVPAFAQRLLLLFSTEFYSSASGVPENFGPPTGMRAWQAAADAIFEELADGPVTVIRSYNYHPDHPEAFPLTAIFLVDFARFMTNWTGISFGPPADFSLASASGFSGDVLAYYAYSQYNPEPPATPGVPFDYYDAVYKALKYTLDYPSLHADSLPLNNRFQGYVSRFPAPAGADPVAQAAWATDWTDIQAGYGGAYPLEAVNLSSNVTPDIDTVKAFFGLP